METRVLVVAAGLACLLLSGSVSAEQRQQIRFYKVNNKEQTSRIMFTARKGKQAGCHNFLKKTRVYQANQFGFASCRLYAAKDCAEESVIEVNRTRDETPVTQLSQGFSWFPISEHKRGVKLRSWSCTG